MAISEELQYAKLDELYLDAKNPRLAHHDSEGDFSQEKVLDLMRSWVLDELAVSYLESGFWTHEALLVIQEELEGELRLVVIEGNRRLAALKYLHAAIHQEQISGKPATKKWSSLVENRNVPGVLFNRVPYIQVGSREEVESFLGFRHVTGIKQWHTEQKAQFAKLIEQGMTYEEVMRKIGSRTSTVRQHYISHRFSYRWKTVCETFLLKTLEVDSVMYLSLRTQAGIS